jgi:hypothetical protein
MYTVYTGSNPVLITAACDFVWIIPDKFSHPNSGRVELFFLEKWWFQKKM